MCLVNLVVFVNLIVFVHLVVAVLLFITVVIAAVTVTIGRRGGGGGEVCWDGLGWIGVKRGGLKWMNRDGLGLVEVDWGE